MSASIRDGVLKPVKLGVSGKWAIALLLRLSS
jgi:hypothetical protein